MNYKQFYVNLGKLVYAIAMADGSVQQEEIEKFREDLNELLIPLQEGVDEFGMDSAFYTEFEFEKLLDKKVSMKEAFDSFMIFIDENKSDFTIELKAICIKIVENVANAYQGVVKEERELINALTEKLNSI
ncbi:MAG: hypothetical protein K9J13_11335 [Saprospiraceae bacterium]|nr:hypothetical protein [Saprospiraceae bacterium]